MKSTDIGGYTTGMVVGMLWALLAPGVNHGRTGVVPHLLLMQLRRCQAAALYSRSMSLLSSTAIQVTESLSW
jgi:hypothetical protein